MRSSHGSGLREMNFDGAPPSSSAATISDSAVPQSSMLESHEDFGQETLQMAVPSPNGVSSVLVTAQLLS